jgi:EAL domain-containing protein (putative c-di-GMP-specific phosphodiesterase class I)
LARPMELDAQIHVIATSIGATLCAPAGSLAAASENSTSAAMAQAELAMRWAKQAGSGGCVVYSAERDDRFRNEAILARSLEGAMRNGELELHYQPLVDLASGRIVAAEALVRWNHPTLGMQRPDLFIPLAEKSGVIVQLGQWVIEQAMRQRSLWKAGGLAVPPIAINVSGVQLADPGFVTFVTNALRSVRSRAEDFEIELTESQLIEASPQIVTSLHALRDMGFKIAIDDFGSGHATFRYLRDFPVDKLKIDQLFVRKLVLDSSDALIIRAIISLARSMGISVVAEGVETEMQREFLQREGCEVAQGYLFSLPLVAEDFAWLLAENVQLPMPSHVDRMSAISATTSKSPKRARAG